MSFVIRRCPRLDHPTLATWGVQYWFLFRSIQLCSRWSIMTIFAATSCLNNPYLESPIWINHLRVTLPINFQNNIKKSTQQPSKIQIFPRKALQKIKLIDRHRKNSFDVTLSTYFLHIKKRNTQKSITLVCWRISQTRKKRNFKQAKCKAANQIVIVWQI